MPKKNKKFDKYKYNKKNHNSNCMNYQYPQNLPPNFIVNINQPPIFYYPPYLQYPQQNNYYENHNNEQMNYNNQNNQNNQNNKNNQNYNEDKDKYDNNYYKKTTYKKSKRHKRRKSSTYNNKKHYTHTPKEKYRKKKFFDVLKETTFENNKNRDKNFEVIGFNITPEKTSESKGTSTDFIDHLINDIFFKKKSDSSDKVIKKAPIVSENNFDLDKEYENLPFELKTIDDLIKLGKLYNDEKPHQFGINMKRLSFMIDSLIKFNKVIGMSEIKTIIFNKIITYIQGLGKIDDMLNIVIQAPPGYGKTMLGYLLSEIFYKMGIIKKSTCNDKKKYFHPITNEEIDFPFVIAKRKDLIGEFLGQTAPKVEKKVKEAEGGVLFIDEAYSLGTSSSRKESYSETCLNTLNQLLSEKAGNFICIIAGYKDELKKSFFTNPGLERRFRLILTIPLYKSSELVDIFSKMIKDDEWKLADSILLNTNQSKLLKFIENNKDNFKFCGGDMQALLQNCRDAHSVRVLGKHPKLRKIITMDDIYNGYDLFIKNMDRKKDNHNLEFMYC